jgi:hypothetical protein
MAEWGDRPEPALSEWLSAAQTYFANRGYLIDDVRLLVERQRHEIDHIIKNASDQDRLGRLVTAIFGANEGVLAETDKRPRVFRRTYDALALCFSDLPRLTFKRGIVSTSLAWVGYVAAGVSFFLVSYLVVGALLNGQSDFEPAQTSPVGGLTILVLLLILLAYVEGSHISIAKLQGANISHADAHPRVVRLHRAVRSEEDSSRFFAGRQILVIIIVFFVSRLTSFPKLDVFPWTTIPLPTGWLSFLTVIFIRYGIAGAIFVYWLGQMVPQLIANKYPTWVMKGVFGELVARSAKLIGNAGIAAPAEFAAKFFPSEPPIPQAARERYLQHASDNGWSYLLQSKEWRFTDSTAEFTYRYVVDFRVPGMEVFSAIVLEVLRKLNPTARVITRLFRGRLNETAVETSEEELIEHTVGQSAQFIMTASPKHGNFEAGDILSGEVQGKTQLQLNMEDGFVISQPVQHFAFRCVFANGFGIGAPIVYIDRVIEEGRNPARDEILLPIEDHEDGFKKFEFAIPHPPTGTRFRFVWTFDEG